MDAPTRFGDYQPEDFDRVFHGEVSVREALINSLNVPAVSVLDKVGPAVFQGRLEAVGVDLVVPKAGMNESGLALALGGEGIRLNDLALLYAALGDHGLAKPLAYTLDDEASNNRSLGHRLMRAEAADKIIQILRETPPPEGRLPGPLMRNANRPAFKTGTSYGYRDAIAVGVAGGYAVMVWTGRPDGGGAGRPDRARSRRAPAVRRLRPTAGAVADPAGHRAEERAVRPAGARYAGNPRLDPVSAVGRHRLCRNFGHRCRRQSQADPAAEIVGTGTAAGELVYRR